MNSLSYTVDTQGLLIHIGANWSRFAVENAGAHLKPDKILNRYIWSFISGLETRFLYKVVMEYVRKRQTSVEFPFRCDAPDRRRFLSMCISPNEDHSCGFTSTLLREEKRLTMKLLDVSFSRSAQWLPICSWCKKVKGKMSNWCELEEFSADLADENMLLPTLLHSVCPPCQKSVLALIEQSPGATQLY